MRDIANISLLEILPPTIRNDEQVQAAVGAIDARFQEIAAVIPKLALMYSIDGLSEEWVDELAWQYHVDFYDATLPIEQKRELVKNSLAWHRRKGTPSAVEELITAVFGDGKVEEWWEFSGSPYTFRVITSNAEANTTKQAEFLAALDSVKNIRSYLDAIQVTETEDLPFYMAGVLHVGEFMTVTQEG